MKYEIRNLTDAQVAKLAEYRDEWLRIGLSTEPTNRPAAERGIAKAYRAAKMKPPRVVVWLESPSRGAIGADLLAQVWAQVGAQVWDQVRAQVWAQVRDQVRDQVWAQVWDQVRAQVGAQVRDQVGDQVGDQVRAQVGDQVRDQVWAQVGRACYGLHDAGWLGFYEFFGRECGLQSVQLLNGMNAVARAAGWWWPFAHAVIITERPTSIHRDAANRLHNQNGLAIGYSDGWGIYALHGVRVPAWVVTTPAAEIDPRRMLNEQNAEIRRELLRKIGVERAIHTLGAKTINKSGDYELLEVDFTGSTRRYLKMLNPSIGVWHIEAVHPECSTVEQANNWRAYGDVNRKWQPSQLT